MGCYVTSLHICLFKKESSVNYEGFSDDEFLHDENIAESNDCEEDDDSDVETLSAAIRLEVRFFKLYCS